MSYVFHFEVIADSLPAIAFGAWRTIYISAQAMAMGLAIGIAGAAVMTANDRRLAPLRYCVSGFVELIRNTPLLAQLFLIFFALPRFGVRLSPDLAAVIGLGLNCGAYAIEILRAGIQSVPSGQIEAGLALGLRRWQVFRLVVLVPAVRAVYPALTSQFIITLLSSSVVSSISAVELTSTAAMLQMSTFRAFEIYLTVTAVYLALSVGFRTLFQVFYRGVIARDNRSRRLWQRRSLARGAAP